jgi:hypothetical protein
MTALFVGEHSSVGFHPEIKKIVLQQLAVDAGVEIHFETVVCAVKTEDLKAKTSLANASPSLREIKAISYSDANGYGSVSARVFVDSTGDGDVAAMAGAEFIFGRDFDLLPHAYSQSSIYLRKDENGKIILSHNNFDAGYCDPRDSWDLTRAKIIGLMEYQKDLFPEENRLLYFANILGLRNSRLIKGESTITLTDQIVCREFDDVIAYTYSHYDNHAFDLENESLESVVWAWILGNWNTHIGSELSFGALLPKGIEGLIMGCRAISLEFDAHNQLRMQRDMQRIGEVAGLAAALCAKSDSSVRSIDVGKLQKKLCELGALQHPESGYHHDDWKPETLFSRKLKHQKAISACRDLLSVVKQIFNESELQASMASSDPLERYNAALLLALRGWHDAFPELIKYVEERFGMKKEPSRGKNSSFQPAILVLGWEKCVDAVPVIEKILEDSDVDQASLICALRSLGEIGDANSAKAIRKMLERDDLPKIHFFKRNVGEIKAVFEDSLWKLELAAARTLAKLGAKYQDLPRKYLNDPRAYVRNYAQEVLK